MLRSAARDFIKKKKLEFLANIVLVDIKVCARFIVQYKKNFFAKSKSKSVKISMVRELTLTARIQPLILCRYRE